MLKRVLIASIVLWISSIVFAQNVSHEFSGWQWYDDGIRFTYPYSIADNVGSRWLPASHNQAESVQLFFENYHGNGQWLETGATIDIMPISSLPGGLSNLAASLDALQASGGVDLQNQLSGMVQSGDIPIAVTEALALNFQSGSGFRFIAQVGGEMNIVRLSYRYFGKTADNNYLIMALIPLSGRDFESVMLNDLDTMISTLSITAPDSALLTTQSNGQVDYEGIHFSYDVSLAYRVEIDYVAPISGAEAQSGMFGVMPGYQQFSFAGYPVVGNIQSPHLYVMPVSEFPDTTQVYGQRLVQLQTLLAERPVLNAAAGDDLAQAPLPILPMMNAAQVLVAHPQYMRSGNGEGLRYITFYSQSFLPVNASDLFYVYVGLSDDGRHVVAAIFPLHVGFLPEGQGSYDIADFEQYAMNYQTYLDGLLLQINVMSLRSFSPQIHLLDELLASLIVE